MVLYGRSRRCLKLVIASVSVLVNIPHGWTSTKQPQQRTYDAFFKNVQLHVYATLRPTEIKRGQPHIATLVLFNDHPVPALDDLVRDSVASQFQAERIGTPREGNSEDEISDEAHDGGETSGEEKESGADKSGDDEGDRVR
ncbi:Hypothetical predicted protein [Olea europaea subsp. europaea]|uniref:Uncharacterized protein n=1 Tax=Olea europaea subsp. europaea TaxID=158383 RepID=A0A8S0TWT0_OLEEU|nr:Hypothetical predicted protein [Olea europaea subsp. europaea]